MYIEQEEYVKRIERTMKGRKHLTHDERVSIGSLTKLVGPTEAAEITGVSKQRADSLGDAIITDSAGVNQELKADINVRVKSTVDNVKDELLDGISRAIDEMKENLVNTTKPQEAAATAKMLAETFEKISGKVVTSGGESKVQILINAPIMKTEKDYEVISSS
jgi:hypothetical protein